MTSQTPLKSASGPQLASRAYTETESEIPELHPRPFGTLYSATFISAVTVPTLTHPHAGTAFATCPEQQRQCDLTHRSHPITSLSTNLASFPTAHRLKLLSQVRGSPQSNRQKLFPIGNCTLYVLAPNTPFDQLYPQMHYCPISAPAHVYSPPCPAEFLPWCSMPPEQYNFPDPQSRCPGSLVWAAGALLHAPCTASSTAHCFTHFCICKT